MAADTHGSDTKIYVRKNTVNFVSNTQFYLSERDRNDLWS